MDPANEFTIKSTEDFQSGLHWANQVEPNCSINEHSVLEGHVESGPLKHQHKCLPTAYVLTDVFIQQPVC